MENKTIRIALSSVLIYLIFKKSYDILTELLLWLNVELRIDNKFTLIALNIILGILSLLFLFFLYNKFLKKETPNINTVYILIALTVIFGIANAGIHKLYGGYLVETDIKDFRTTYLFQFGWTKILDMIFPIVGLSYFLWKLKTDKNTVANTV